VESITDVDHGGRSLRSGRRPVRNAAIEERDVHVAELSAAGASPAEIERQTGVPPKNQSVSRRAGTERLIDRLGGLAHVLAVMRPPAAGAERSGKADVGSNSHE
jgi:hypothetical protein